MNTISVASLLWGECVCGCARAREWLLVWEAGVSLCVFSLCVFLCVFIYAPALFTVVCGEY